MNYIKCLLIFIVFSMNNVFADTASTETSNLNHTEICGDKSCEFLFKEMRKFAKNGSPLAQATLSVMYADGIGTYKDQDLSFKYIRKAANNGLPFAEYTLGMVYRESRLVDKFGKDADYWLMRAAEGGYKPAIDLLLSDNAITLEEVKIYQEPIRTSVSAPVTDEEMEVIVITADKYTLTDFHDLLKSRGHGKVNQTGSRIKGRGCSHNSCTIVDINSDMGALQYILSGLKTSR
jgi:hypothetical protein